ncbi:uncharacterized protein TRIVIDRAFT_205766 [Trichoderma virens Gv29-8]|uniref:Mid2 domain-containing protein n=1 Tax=Hypocrea virens (strain Gv29-8 / FGSC 10586) TaxID=413071 RepID=G9N845_HYPVG|nr:uncharacterized protein TRIVIDRAFT_205766 [Trichoderma virens Gv29-8]EHK17155.1 hypothetical protein TRIVIDRAFT_205766 [Trichoderma virens Gv29-8]UKZ55572.1 hypothetical protein TrVGV298_009396 [Trichoderma virens]
MMRCFRILVLVAAVVSGSDLELDPVRVTTITTVFDATWTSMNAILIAETTMTTIITISDGTSTPTDVISEVTAITLTTIITVFDGTATPTDSIETSTESSVSLPSVFITLPRPSRSSSSQLASFITRSIPHTMTTDSILSFTTMTSSPSSSSSTPVATQQPETVQPSTTDHSISLGKIWGIAIGCIILGFILFVCIPLWLHKGGGYEVLKRWFGGSRRTGDEDRETIEQLQGQGLETQEVMPPAELDATMEYRGSASVLEGPCSHHPVATRIAEELDGSNVASHNPVSISQRPEFVAVELPTSVDPGNSPLPRYEDLDTDERHRVFSWAAPESTYRPEKLGIEDSN